MHFLHKSCDAYSSLARIPLTLYREDNIQFSKILILLLSAMVNIIFEIKLV